MTTIVGVLVSFLIIELVSALRIIPQNQTNSGNTQEPQPSPKIEFVPTTESTMHARRRSNLFKDMLIGAINRDLKMLKLPGYDGQGKINGLRQDEFIKDIAAEPNYSPQHTEQQHVDEAELLILSRNTGKLKSGLLGKPYIETKGKNDYLVIQSETFDPFVTIIPNSIYYNAEKKCVNWLDACSVRGIRNHLLEKVEYVK